MEKILRHLTPRLKMIADMTPECLSAADVGSDHGYVAIYLQKAARARKIIVSDINEGPLLRARRNINALCGEGGIETRLSDGLRGYLAGEVETVIIAGMGGELIIKIIGDADLSEAKYMVLQPMTAAYELRRFLHKSGWKIVREDLAREGEKFYTAILAQRGREMPWGEAQYQIGKRLIQDGNPLLLDYLEYRLFEVKRALRGQRKAKSPDLAAQQGFLRLINEYEGLIKECGK